MVYPCAPATTARAGTSAPRPERALHGITRDFRPLTAGAEDACEKRMTDTKTYSGGCHCGKVRYEVTADLSQVMECNCSICAKKASLLTFVGPDQFKLLSGESEVSDYQFNTKNIHHLFCKTCGIHSFAR